MEAGGVGGPSPQPAAMQARVSNPLLRQLTEEECVSGASAAVRVPGSCVMRELATYLEQQRLLPAGSLSSLGPVVGAASSETATEGRKPSQFSEKSEEGWRGCLGSRMRVQLQPDVDACCEKPSTGEEGEDDGGAALESKTAEFEFLYDDDADEEDSRWVDETLRVGDRKSDALLSCAGCFAPVCYQCQRHESIQGLFRSVTAVRVKLGPPALHPEAASVASGERQVDNGESVAKQGADSSAPPKTETSKDLDAASALITHIKSRLAEQTERHPQTSHSEPPPTAPHCNAAKKAFPQKSVRFAATEKAEREELEEDSSTKKVEGGVYSLICTACETIVGWRDASEVFFFDQVLPSEA